MYQIFRVSQKANRWRIINQIFAKSRPLDARVQNFCKRPLQSLRLAGASDLRKDLAPVDDVCKQVVVPQPVVHVHLLVVDG